MAKKSYQGSFVKSPEVRQHQSIALTRYWKTGQKLDQTYYQRNQERAAIVDANYRKANLHKYLAAEMARDKIELASGCALCGGTKNLERHHPDYSKPLEIVTLCHKCHCIEHEKMKIANYHGLREGDRVETNFRNHKRIGVVIKATWTRAKIRFTNGCNRETTHWRNQMDLRKLGKEEEASE